MERGVHPKGWTYDNIAAMRERAEGAGPVDRLVAASSPPATRTTTASSSAWFLELLAARPGLSQGGRGQLGPGRHDRAGQRAGHRRPRLALGRAGREAQADPVVPAHHRLRRRPDRRPEDPGPLAREGPADAGELDRPQPRACASGFEFAGGRARRVADEHRGLHHPPRHPVRRQLRRHRRRPPAGRAHRRRATRRPPPSWPSAAAAAPPKPRSRPARRWASTPASRSTIPSTPAATLPVWIANFVLMDYGTGAIFGCPAHDQRDLEFARKYDLPVTPVVLPPGADPADLRGRATRPTPAPGTHLPLRLPRRPGRSRRPRPRPIARIEAAGRGEGATVYRLRDWGVSRQRYWGCPIPIIHCANCGPVPVPDDQLPVELPDDVTFDRPGNPLLRHPTWRHVTCPSCGGPAERETDTLDTFVDSSWYFARFADPDAAEPIDRGGGRLLAAGRPVHRRRRARRPAPALRPLHHPRPEGRGPAGRGGAVRRPVHPGHGHPRDLPRGRRRPTGSSPAEIETPRRRAWSRPPRGEPVDRRRHREDVEVEEERRRAGGDLREPTASTPRACSSCPTARPSATCSGPHAGVEGAWRFVHRIWGEFDAHPAGPLAAGDAARRRSRRRAAPRHPPHHQGGDRGDRQLPLQQRHRPAVRVPRMR